MSVVISLLQSVTGLVAALAALLAAVVSLIKAFRDVKEASGEGKSKSKEPEFRVEKSRLSVFEQLVKKRAFIFGMLLVFISAGIFTVRFIIPPLPQIAVSIPNDGDAIQVFQRNGGAGSFIVEGISSGIFENQNARIYVLVHPAQPFGEGWWIQQHGTVDQSGKWKTEAWIGNDEYPPHRGDRIDVLAVVSKPAVVGGLKRVDDPKDIKPFVQSPIISVTIRSLKGVSIYS